MESIEELKMEHRAVERGLAIMQGISGRLSAGEQVDQRHLEQIGEFLHVFADRCHHGKEEGLLFPALEQAGIPYEGGLIVTLLVEHSTGRAFVQGMQQATAAYRADQPGAGSDWAKNALGYVSLLKQHIAKEDQTLFPMAEENLSADQDRALVAGFEQIETERVGPGRHEAFHHMLHELERTYVAG